MKLNTQRDNQSFLVSRRLKLIERATKPELHIRFLLDSLKEKYVFQKGFYNEHRFYIVDFYLKYRDKLCLEIDGESHKNSRFYDLTRDRFLVETRGLRVIRITNKKALSLTENELLKLIK